MPRRRTLCLETERKKRKVRASTYGENLSPKMLYCVMENCSSSNNKRSMGYNPYVNFFSFPKDKATREKWIERCCQKYRFDANSSKICSLHFSTADYLDRGKLRAGAIPTKNLPKKLFQRNIVQDLTASENTDPLVLPATIKHEETIYVQEEITANSNIDLDSLWKESAATDMKIEVKEEHKADPEIELEMEVEEDKNEFTIKEEQTLNDQEVFFVTQSPSPVIEQSSSEEDDNIDFSSRIEIVRESPSFRSPISVRDIRTLTSKEIPTLVPATPPAVPLQLREVPRSEAIKALLKKPPALIRAPQHQDQPKQYVVKKPPPKIIKRGIDGVVHLSNPILINQNNEDTGGGSDSNQIRKRIRVISVNQVNNRGNGNTLPLIRQNEVPCNTKAIGLNETDAQSQHRPHVGRNPGETVKKPEPVNSKCTSSSPESICVLCSFYTYTSLTYDIQPMVQSIAELVDVNISELNLPLRACAQCIRDANVALRFKYRVKSAFQKLIKNKSHRSKGVTDDPIKNTNTRSQDVVGGLIPTHIEPEKPLRTYSKSINNVQKSISESKSKENISASCSQKGQNDSSVKLMSFKDNKQLEAIDVDMIDEDDDDDDDDLDDDDLDSDIDDNNDKNNTENPNRIIKSIVNKEFEIDQDEIMEIRESQLKNSHIMTINERQSDPLALTIIDSEKDDSDDECSCKKTKKCFCMYNIPRDVFALPDNQLRREFAKEKYITSRCLRCFQLFPNVKNLKRHIRRRCSLYAVGPQKKFMDDIETRSCDLCPSVFRSHIDVLIHKDSIHNNNNCSDCLMKFKDSNAAAKHKEIHKTDQTVVCLYCARPVSSRGYRVHRIAHGWDWWTWRRRRCNQCNDEIANIKEIFTCTLCQKKFNNRTVYKQHLSAHKNKVIVTTMPPKRALWSEDALASAVLAVQSGTLSTYKAAMRYGVPRRTIRNHFKSGNVIKTLGRKAILNSDQETDFVNRINRFAEIGLPVTSRILRHLVYKFCELNDIKHSFNKNNRLAGRDWFKAFMKRHPEISKRKAQFINSARTQKLNKFIVDDHFERISEIYNQLDLKDHPERIYNMGEKSCRLKIHHQQAGAKKVDLISSEHAESVTIAGCVNALGTAIPPMIIFKGNQLKPEFYDNLPAGSLVENSSKGYMTNELFKKFLEHLARYKSGGKCLLVFDGAACHLDLDLSIIEVADSLNISLYCLPSNTTHELQPLDKAVYRSFEHHWDSEVLLFMDQNPEKEITEARFNVILTNVWSKCMTHSNITSGFKATGLYPLNPQAIPEAAFAPSISAEAPTPPVSDAVEEDILGCKSSPVEVPLTSTRSSPMLLTLTNNSPSSSSTNSTSVRPSGSLYPTVYNDSCSDDDKDSMPLIKSQKNCI